MWKAWSGFSGARPSMAGITSPSSRLRVDSGGTRTTSKPLTSTSRAEVLGGGARPDEAARQGEHGALENPVDRLLRAEVARPRARDAVRVEFGIEECGHSPH